MLKLCIVLLSCSFIYAATPQKCKDGQEFNSKTKKCEVIKCLDSQILKENKCIDLSKQEIEIKEHKSFLKGKTLNIHGYFIDNKFYETRPTKFPFERTKDLNLDKIKGYLVQKDSNSFYYVTKDLKNVSFFKGLNNGNYSWLYIKEPFKEKIIEKKSRIIFPLR